MQRLTEATSATFSADQRRILVTVLVPAFMSLLAVSSINVALPSIDDALGAGQTGLQWVVSGYALVFGVVLVAGGRAGDLFGRGRLFTAGLICFGLGSLISGLAPTIHVLNVARLLMGFGSGLLNPQVTGMIQQYFRGELRGRAFGAFGSVVGVSVAIGPLLGGTFIALLGEEWGWRGTFLVNVPIALLAIWAARAFLPSSAWAPVSGQSARDFDPVGMVLLGLGTLLAMLPFVERGLGWWIWLGLPAGIAVIAGWVAWERAYRDRGRSPMVNLDLFRTRSFANGALLIALYFVGSTSIWLLMAQYMQLGRGHTPLAAALIGLPASLASATSSAWAGRRVIRAGRIIVLWGIALVLTGLVLSVAVVLLHARTGLSEWWLLAPLTLLGLGQGMVVSPNQSLTLADVPVEYAGSAGGVLQTGQRLGTSVGIAAVTGVAFHVAGTASWDLALAAGYALIIVMILLAGAVGVHDLRSRRASGKA